MRVDISTLQQLQSFAEDFAQTLINGDVIFLTGDLGSGKTTFTQLLLKSMGYPHRVKSPTYSLYERYEINKLIVYHMDLYRLSSAEELYYLAIDEIFNAHSIVLIEWPEKGFGALPDPSKSLDFEIKNSSTRELKLQIT